MSPGSNYQVVFAGSEEGCAAVEWGAERITAYGWLSTVASVFQEGKIALSCAIRVPEVPGRVIDKKASCRTGASPGVPTLSVRGELWIKGKFCSLTSTIADVTPDFGFSPVRDMLLMSEVITSKPSV